jgi:hypothetical protein
LLIAVACGQTRNKANENTVETPQDTDTLLHRKSENNNFYNELHEMYRYFFENQGYNSFNTEYYENTNYIGLGVANPKDFRFQLTTPDGQKIEIANIEEQELLVPLFWKADYMIFYMTVVEISEDQYRIQANNKMTVWVDKSEFDFYTWENLFRKTTCIVADIAYREKNIQSESIKLTDNNYALIVEKVEGDWLYAKEETEDDIVIDRYWIHWKDKNNKLLVRPIFLM